MHHFILREAVQSEEWQRLALSGVEVLLRAVTEE